LCGGSEDKKIQIKADNFSGLSQLSEEFGFESLRAELSRFEESASLKANSRGSTDMHHICPHFEDVFRFCSGSENIECCVCEAISVSRLVWEQLTIDGCAHTIVLNDAKSYDSIRWLLSSGVKSISGSHNWEGIDEERIDISKTSRFELNSNNLSKFTCEDLENILSGESFWIVSEDDLLRGLLKLGEEYHSLVRWIDIRFLSSDVFSTLTDQLEIPFECHWGDIIYRLTHSRPLGSTIISMNPELFQELGWKRFSLLWRGSRDGFSAKDFHSRCDGHANTLTLILDTKGDIFGGFTPIEWESRVWNGNFRYEDNCQKADPSQKSFLFTLENPHNFPAQRFALKAAGKGDALRCRFDRGPSFNDLWICNKCNAYGDSGTNLGRRYTNNTGLDGEKVFTGSKCFKVKEIEVFEITI
jgi:hypothetical protein